MKKKHQTNKTKTRPLDGKRRFQAYTCTDATSYTQNTPPPPPRKKKKKKKKKRQQTQQQKGEREKGSIYIKYTLKENLPGSRNKTEMASSKTRTEIISYQCCSNAGGIEKDTTCLLAEKNEILLTVYFAHVHT